MNNLYTKIYEAVDTGIQKALIIPDDQLNDVSIKWYEKEKSADFIFYGQRTVDLGLSVKWCEYNLGAFPGNTAKDWYGNYYAWGENEMKSNYSWKNYNHYSSLNDTLIKYNTNKKYGIKDHKTRLELCDDAAQQILKDKFRIPTREEFIELLNNTANEWINDYKGINGLNGRLFTAKNNNVLFIPAAGYFRGINIYFDGFYGRIWSASLGSDRSDYAYKLNFDSNDACVNDCRRRYGCSIRAVQSYF